MGLRDETLSFAILTGTWLVNYLIDARVKFRGPLQDWCLQGHRYFMCSSHAIK